MQLRNILFCSEQARTEQELMVTEANNQSSVLRVVSLRGSTGAKR